MISARFQASSSGVTPAQTPEACIDFGKRAPSSLNNVSLMHHDPNYDGGSLLRPIDDSHIIVCFITILVNRSQSF